MEPVEEHCRKAVIAASCALFAVLASVPQTIASTSYESQIGGFMSALLQTLITGEFAGRSPSNVDAALKRPICRPSDYDDLRAAANDQAAFDAFRQRCRLVEIAVDETHVNATAYLPQGYCATLRNAFEVVLAKQVYADSTEPTRGLSIEYKGSRYLSTRRQLARNAQLKASCQSDDSLRISAPRRPKSA